MNSAGADGYVLGKRLQGGERSRIDAAVRERDGIEVWLKSYLDAEPERANERARSEFEALRKAAGPGVVSAVELLSAKGRSALVMQAVPGTTALRDWVLATSQSAALILDVAIALTEIVSRVHTVRLLHRNLHPDSILVDPATRAVHLLDFSLARPVGGQASEAMRLGSSAASGTLAYSAPEATGRMNRGDDERSDLYSLGATLYFALTGRPPFEGDDPLTLIHAHMAKMPVAATEVRPSVPPTLSRITNKLLQKTPEDRYQTAHALAHDLRECREQLRRSGTIQNDFPLGTADAPHRPLFSKRLYGRETEVARLQQCYARAVAGAPGALLLGGPPGMGKSELVHALRTPLVETGGYLAIGKFDQYRRDLPYSGFAQAFGSLCRQILTESDARLAGWRAEFGQALGAIAGALVSVVPELEFILREVPAVPALGPAETRARLGLAVRNFVRAAATREHPLVLCLDDLQWADAASRDLLRELLLAETDDAVLVLGAYRDTEVDAGHPLALLIAELRQRDVQIETLLLAPLSENACAQMLAAALGRSPEQTRSLASVVARKTGNAPLLIQQFIYYMYDLRLVRFEPGVGWTWDDAALAGAAIPEDAVSLMTAKIARLPEASAAVLELASCVGDAFDLDTLDALTKRPRAEIESALFALCDEGLIAPAAQGFRFVHDRIREAAQGLLSPEQRSELHHQAARRLLERTPPAALEAHAFEIGEHLLLAESRLDAGERTRALEVHLLAGKRALMSGAAATASHYLDAARRQFHEAHWQTHAALGFDLLVHAAEAARQSGEMEKAVELLDAAERQPLDRLQSAMVAAKRVHVHSLTLHATEVIPEILRTLRRFEIDWSIAPPTWRIAVEIWRTDRALRGALDETTFGAQRGDVSLWVAQLLLLTAAGSIIAIHSRNLFVHFTLFMLRSFRRLGAGPGLPISLASWAVIRIVVTADAQRSERYAQAALDWVPRVSDPTEAAKVHYILQAYLHPFTRPRRSVIEPLERSAQELFEVGETEYGLYATMLRAIHRTLSGESLDEVLEGHARLAKRTRGTLFAESLAAQRRVLLLLRDTPQESSEEFARGLTALGEEVRNQHGSRFGSQATWVMVLVVLGRFEDVCVTGEEPVEQEGVFILDLAFYHGIAAAALAADPRQASRRRRLRAVARSCARTLEPWAKQNPEFQHTARGLKAEVARLRGRSRVALALYAQAAQGALAAGFRHHAALLHERRAGLLSELQRAREAAADRNRALALYTEWGARAKVEALQRGAGA